MSDIELGPGKRARAAYSFDEIAIVPSRRTRDPEEVSISWQIDAYKFDLPFICSANGFSSFTSYCNCNW